MPRPTAVSKVNQASWTPLLEVEVPRRANPLGLTSERRAASIAFTSARPSQVFTFQVNATRSRQKPSGSNMPAAASISPRCNAPANFCSHSAGFMAGSDPDFFGSIPSPGFALLPQLLRLARADEEPVLGVLAARPAVALLQAAGCFLYR